LKVEVQYWEAALVRVKVAQLLMKRAC
jgi:hypothetical protein